MITFIGALLAIGVVAIYQAILVVVDPVVADLDVASVANAVTIRVLLAGIGCKGQVSQASPTPSSSVSA